VRSFGARAASSAAVSLTYRHAVVVPTSNPAALGERLAFAQVYEHEQGLPPGVQLPPGRADRGPVAADDAGHEGEGPGRQRQRGAVEKHGSPWWW
jgi:hypothetical protein